MNNENITVQIRHVPRTLNHEAKRLALASNMSLNQWYLDLIKWAVEKNQPATQTANKD